MPQNHPLEHLPAPQRFMYEYGCFMAFWSNFDIIVDVAILKSSSCNAHENCAALAKMTTGQKLDKLESKMSSSETEKIAAIKHISEAVNRNAWVHGSILNPRGDFSQFTRLRINQEKSTGKITVTNEPVDLTKSPFKDFYPAYERFMHTFSISACECNDYIRAIQLPSQEAT